MPITAAVNAELEDQEFLSAVHGRASTYNLGCRGPLCTWANTTKRRESWRQKQIAAGRTPKRYNLSPARAARERMIEAVLAAYDAGLTDTDGNGDKTSVAS